MQRVLHLTWRRNTRSQKSAKVYSLFFHCGELQSLCLSTPGVIYTLFYVFFFFCSRQKASGAFDEPFCLISIQKMLPTENEKSTRRKSLMSEWERGCVCVCVWIVWGFLVFYFFITVQVTGRFLEIVMELSVQDWVWFRGKLS